MDWVKQSQEMMQTWAETQKKMWNVWLQSMEGTGPSAPADIWQTTIETWQQSANQTLEAQAKLTRMWVESLDQFPGSPENLAQWAKQAEAMIAGMTETQKQLWDKCFAGLKRVDVPKTGISWEEEGRKIFDTWQDSAHKAMEAQIELASKWMKR